jgi:hypothetical protein
MLAQWDQLLKRLSLIKLWVHCAAGTPGLVQVYGYHASVLVAQIQTTAKTVNPGTPIGQHKAAAAAPGATIGCTSAPTDEAFAIALDTIGQAHHSLTTPGLPASYADHVFIRAL